MDIGEPGHIIEIIPHSNVSSLHHVPEFRERICALGPGPHLTLIGIAGPCDPATDYREVNTGNTML